METKKDWLREQRARGGYDSGSAMALLNMDAEKYVDFFVNRIERNHDITLDFYVDYNGYEIYVDGQIVWFGRPQDVNLLRTIRVSLFEEILLERIDRLKNLELLIEA